VNIEKICKKKFTLMGRIKEPILAPGVLKL